MPIGRKVLNYSSQAKRSTVRFYFGAGRFSFYMLGGRAGGRAWWRESPTTTLVGRRENERGGASLTRETPAKCGLAGGLTALFLVRPNNSYKNTIVMYMFRNNHTMTLSPTLKLCNIDPIVYIPRG